MRSAQIDLSRGRKLSKTLPRPPISIECNQNRSRCLAQPAIPPLAGFDDSETESETSSTSAFTYDDESYNGYTQDRLIRSSNDYRRVMHQRQLTAIRKLINESDANSKGKPRGNGEVDPIVERMDDESERGEQCQPEFQNNIHIREQSNPPSKLEESYPSFNSYSLTKLVDIDEKKPIQTKHLGNFVKSKPVPPPKPILQKRIPRMETKYETKSAVPGQKFIEEKRTDKEDEKLRSKTICEPLQSRTANLNRPVSMQMANQDSLKKKTPEKYEYFKPFENPGISPTKPSPRVYEKPVKPHLRENNGQRKTQTPQEKTPPLLPPKPPFKHLKTKPVPLEKPSLPNLNSTYIQRTVLPPTSPTIASTRKDAAEEISKNKVAETIKLFEQNATDEKTSTNSIKPVMRTKKRMVAPRDFSCDGCQTPPTYAGENIPTSKAFAFYSNPPGDCLGHFNGRRPIGAVSIYTNQGPQLLREIKDRFRTRYGVPYDDPEPNAQGSQSSSLHTDSPVLPGVDQSFDEVPQFTSLPMNITSDLSHILPDILKERPRRAGRPPTKRLILTNSEDSTSTIDI